MTTVEDRLNAYQQASTLLPDATEMDVARFAEWLLTGALALTPERVQAAARELASHDRNTLNKPVNYDNLGPDGRAEYEGRAARVVVAYLQHGKGQSA